MTPVTNLVTIISLHYNEEYQHLLTILDTFHYFYVPLSWIEHILLLQTFDHKGILKKSE